MELGNQITLEFARFILADIEKYTRLGRRINLKLSD